MSMDQTREKVDLRDLRSRREQIMRLAEARGVRRLRVFGSVSRNEAQAGSDIDFLVEMEPGRTVLDISELILDLEELLGHPVDVTEIRHSSELADRIEREAVPL